MVELRGGLDASLARGIRLLYGSDRALQGRAHPVLVVILSICLLVEVEGVVLPGWLRGVLLGIGVHFGSLKFVI